MKHSSSQKENFLENYYKSLEFLDLKKYEQSIEKLDLAIRTNRFDYVPIGSHKTNALFKLRKKNEAIKTFDKKEMELKKRWIKSMNDKILEVSLNNYEKTLRQNKKSSISLNYTEHLNKKGFLFRDLKQSKAALDFYDKSIQLKPNREAYLNKALLYKELNQFKKALDNMNKAHLLEINYNDKKDVLMYEKVLFHKGTLLMNMKNYETALNECFEELIKLTPYTHRFHLKKAICLTELEKYDEAMLSFKDAIKLSNCLFDQSSRTIIEFIENKNYFELLKHIKYEAKMKPIYFETYECMKKSIDNLLKKKESIRIEKENNSIDKLFVKGKEMYDMHKLKEALEYFNKILEFDDKDISRFIKRKVFYYQGLINMDLEHFYAAISCFDKLTEAKANDYNEHNECFKKGLCYLQIKDYFKALLCFNKTIELKPSFFDAYLKKSFILNHLKQYEKSYECLNEMIQVCENNQLKAEAYFNMGKIDMKMSNYERALKCFDAAINFDSQYTDAIMERKQLLYEINCNNLKK